MSVVVVTIAALIVSMLAMMCMLVLPAALVTIARLVLRGAHEIHRPVAGVLLVAVLAPVLRVTRRHVQIDRLHPHRLTHHHRHADYQLRSDDRRWRAVCEHHLARPPRSDFDGAATADTHPLH